MVRVRACARARIRYARLNMRALLDLLYARVRGTCKKGGERRRVGGSGQERWGATEERRERGGQRKGVREEGSEEGRKKEREKERDPDVREDATEESLCSTAESTAHNA